jgi:hypothetical protein
MGPSPKGPCLLSFGIHFLEDAQTFGETRSSGIIGGRFGLAGAGASHRGARGSQRAPGAAQVEIAFRSLG